jgi:hypothetical protein
MASTDRIRANMASVSNPSSSIIFIVVVSKPSSSSLQ